MSRASWPYFDKLSILLEDPRTQVDSAQHERPSKAELFVRVQRTIADTHAMPTPYMYLLSAHSCPIQATMRHTRYKNDPPSCHDKNNADIMSSMTASA